MLGKLNRAEEGTLGIIPARGGSKSVLKKNLFPLDGRPLISYAIELARLAKTVDRCIVSTDDEEIAEVAKGYGAEVPFMRPEEFAQDDTPDLPVFEHALAWLQAKEGYVPDLVVHLRPTSPLCRPERIDEGVLKLAASPQADSLRAVCIPDQTPYKMWRIGEDGYMCPLLQGEFSEPYNMPRQELPEVYWQTGYVDVVRTQTIREKNSMTGDTILPLVIDSDEVIDIDSRDDFRYAEFRMSEGP